MVCFNLKNIFPQVPVNAALIVIEDSLTKYPTLGIRTSIPAGS